MHPFKNQIDFNKLKGRELVNKKKSKAILNHIRKPKKLSKKVRNYTLFFCGSPFTNAPIKKPNRLQQIERQRTRK